MVGITSIGAYIPKYRLSLEEIGKMFVYIFDEVLFSLINAAGLPVMSSLHRRYSKKDDRWERFFKTVV